MPKYEFEVVEEYFLNGEHRFRLKVRGTNLVVNVAAASAEEAASKAASLLDKVKAYSLLGDKEAKGGGPSSP
ncbi:MAG: hypothetical protein ACP5HK_00130 [Acidilobus sp.]